MPKNLLHGLFLVWILVILLAVVPWSQFQNHPHWARVVWIPSVSAPALLVDILQNTLLYLPFGYLHARQRSRPPLWQTAVLALGLSLATEFTQVFSHGRFPSATDVTCNLVGALWGSRWGRSVRS